MDLDDCMREIDGLKAQVQNNTNTLAEIKAQLTALQSSNQSLETILRYVVTPLIAVVGVLVGIRLVA